MNKILFTLLWLLLSFQANAQKSICGETDDRIPSNNSKMGRVNDGDKSVCTVTMIGKKCALTAGHCRWILNEVSFNVPKTRNGDLGRSIDKDRYEVDRDSIFWKENGVGDDYAVLELLPNKITGEYAGIAQGHYDVSFDRPKAGDEIFVVGYGKDSEPDRHHSQQIHQASILRLNNSIIEHNVDTRFGNSGSVIIDQVTNKVIGIHTHGACYSGGGSNYGTLISAHPSLMQAIRGCLIGEDKN